MLRIKLGIKNVHRASDSPSVSFLTLVSVTPGSCYDLIKATPSNPEFYLYLPAAHDGKTARSISALLPAKYPQVPQWQLAAQHLLDYQPPPEVSYSESILHLIAYETVSNPVPLGGDDSSGKSEAGKPLGELEEYVLNNDASLAQVDETTALHSLGFDTLATVRIGHARVSIVELARAVGEAGERGTAAIDVPLIDISDSPPLRGTIELELMQVAEITNGVTKLAVTTPPGFYPRVTKQVPTYSKEFYDSLVNQSRKTIYQDYVNFYVKMFPPLPSEKARLQELLNTGEGVAGDAITQFATTNSNLGYQARPGSNEVEIKKRLLASSENIATMHAPVVSINGDVFVPIGYYYKRPINPEFISERHHQYYFGSILDSMCKHFGTTSKALAATIHRGLDSASGSKQSNGRDYSEFLAAVRIVGLFLTHLNTAFRYRADFALGKGKGGDPTSGVQIREDTSMDLIMGMNSEDCDGMENAVHAICFIIWTGITTKRNPQLEGDKLYQTILTAVRPTKQFGGWTHEGLNALQRLLFYYTPISTVGGTTANFPGEEGSSSIRINVPSMVNLPQDSSHEASKLYKSAAELGQLQCHRWGMMLPVQTVVQSLTTCFDAEDAEGVTRVSKDQTLVNRLRAIREGLVRVAPFAVLPPILLEGTVPTNPFAMFGASSWMHSRQPEHDETATVSRLEANMRDLSLHNKNAEGSNGGLIGEDLWSPRGVLTLDEGIGQWLLEDNKNRKASLFYKVATCCDIPIFNELFDTTEFTCAFVTQDCSSFGVEIETIMGRSPGKYGLVMPLHRIPIDIRDRAAQIANQTVKWRPPAQLGAYAGVNTQMPHEQPGSEAPAADPTSTQLNSRKVFGRTLVAVNLNIISPQHLQEFEETLKERGAAEILKVEEKLQPYGPRTAIYSFVPPVFVK